MKLIAMLLSVLLGSCSFALAQNSGSSAPAASSSSTNETTGSSPNAPRVEPVPSDKMNADTGSTGQPTNSINDHSVSRTTGNPGLQTGPVK